MKGIRLLYIVSILMLFLLSVSVFAEEEMPYGKDCMVQIREKPDGLAPVIAEARADEIEVLKEMELWATVMYKGNVGYAYLPQLGIENIALLNKRSVTIFTTRKAVMQEGEPVYLTSEIIGMDDISYTCQWQWNRGDGWEDIPGAIDETYMFLANTETLTYDWRLKVHIE